MRLEGRSVEADLMAAVAVPLDSGVSCLQAVPNGEAAPNAGMGLKSRPKDLRAVSSVLDEPLIPDSGDGMMAGLGGRGLRKEAVPCGFYLLT